MLLIFGFFFVFVVEINIYHYTIGILQYKDKTFYIIISIRNETFFENMPFSFAFCGSHYCFYLRPLGLDGQFKF